MKVHQNEYENQAGDPLLNGCLVGISMTIYTITS